MVPNGAVKALPWGAVLAWHLSISVVAVTANDVTPSSDSQPARLYVALLGTSP